MLLLQETVGCNQVIDNTGAAVSVQLSSSADLSQLTSLGRDMLGELDPQTGIFYSSQAGTPVSTRNIIVTAPSNVSGGRQVVHRTGTVRTVESVINPVSTVTTKDMSCKPMDFLSSALSQAQIELDPYQFIDEDEPSIAARLASSSSSSSSSSASSSRPSAVHVLSSNNVSTSSNSQGAPLMSLLNPTGSQTHPAIQQQGTQHRIIHCT